MEEGGRHYVGQKIEETTKRKSVGNLRGISIIYGLGILALTETGEDTDSRKQLGPKNMQINLRR